MPRSGVELTIGLTAALVGVSPATLAAEPDATRGVGDTSLGLPGVVRAPVVGVTAPRLALAADGGYAYTESQDSEGAHHRIVGQLGIGVAPYEWLEFGLAALMRHDRHPDDGMGKDTGTNSSASLVARAGNAVGSGFRLGADLAATFPGSEKLADSFKSPALDARLLFGWGVPDSLRLAGFAGYRFDWTEGVAKDRDRYRLGDRLALGASEFDAVLAGLGASVPLGTTELLAEVSGDILVGSGAPSALESPLRAELGARFAVAARASLQLLGSLSLSQRPDVGPDEPLIPVEPRVGVFLGFRYRFYDGPEVKSSVTPAPKPPPPPPKKQVAPPPPEPKPKAEEPPPPPTNSVQVVVVDKNTGHPLSDAAVELIVAGETRPLTFLTGSTFRLDEVPVGSAELVVRAERLQDYHQPLEVTEGEPIEVNVEMTPAANSGQIRGLIRGFDGKGLVAHVRIQPGNREIESDVDGSFRVDVPPGTYQVEVTLAGYRSQRLRAVVGKDGVVVLNVDLSKGGG